MQMFVQSVQVDSTGPGHLRYTPVPQAGPEIEFSMQKVCWENPITEESKERVGREASCGVGPMPRAQDWFALGQDAGPVCMPWHVHQQSCPKMGMAWSQAELQ